MDNNQRDRRPHDIERNLEDVTLIWCDPNIDDSFDSRCTQTLLREMNNYVQFYTNPQLCLDFIRSIENEKILLVISDAFEKQILSEICLRPTVISIFLLCADHLHHTSLSISDQYQKTIQIFTDKQALIKSIKSRVHFITKQTIEFTVFDNKRQKSARDISKEFASFLWYQLLIDILRQMSPDTDQALHDMLEKCSEYYRLNTRMLEMIEQFRTQYTRDKAVEWYTAASFIYRLINKALRTEDIELLYLFRLYIVDLCWQLEQEHKKLPTTEVLTLYRGQEMPAEEFERLKQNTDILVSPNGFFSTSKDLNVALDFIAGGCDTDENRIVLFEITADPRLESVIFADIHTLSKMPEESEFLFSLGAVFVIKDVKYDPSINAWKVYMTAVDDGSKQKTEHFKLIQQQMDEGYKPTILFGDLLWRNMGEYDKAQKYFETILESLPHDHEDMPYVYYQLGCVFNQKDEWNVALDFFKKSYDLHCQHLPSDHPQLATSLRAIGLMYAYKQDYDQALHYYNQAFDFYKNYSSDHLDMAHVLMNIGIVFREKKQYDNALDYFTKALKIYQRLLPEHHYMIARWLDNTGRLYDDQLNFDRALDFYHQQYEMNEKIFPSEHIYLADDLNKIVNTYKKNGEYEKAINFSWMKFLQQKQDLPEMHIRKAHTLQTLGDLYSEKDISQAFVYYDEALMIFENCVPRDQPALVRCLERISDVYYNLSTYDEALKYRQKALNIQQNFRSSQHLNIGHTLQWLGKIYFNIKNYSQALDSLRRALQIYEVNYGSEHEKFKETRQYIDEIEATLRNDY